NRDVADIELDIQDLIWDKVNEPHIRQKHHVSRADVEEVAYGPASELYVRGTYSNRYFVTGPKADGALLVLILAPKDRGRYYPVTAYEADNKDRREYYQWKAEQQR
ncbi:MAG: hypothetical protein M3Y74_15305, partial [Chloroflexota bacterium]|nr:hypothetical protein [Chloroflexota bacterium]